MTEPKERRRAIRRTSGSDLIPHKGCGFATFGETTCDECGRFIKEKRRLKGRRSEDVWTALELEDLRRTLEIFANQRDIGGYYNPALLARRAASALVEQAVQISTLKAKLIESSTLTGEWRAKAEARIVGLVEVINGLKDEHPQPPMMSRAICWDIPATQNNALKTAREVGYGWITLIVDTKYCLVLREEALEAGIIEE